jgi:hypothetical protein
MRAVYCLEAFWMEILEVLIYNNWMKKDKIANCSEYEK